MDPARHGRTIRSEWTGGFLAIAAVVALWAAVLGGIATPLAQWLERGGRLESVEQVPLPSASERPGVTEVSFIRGRR